MENNQTPRESFMPPPTGFVARNSFLLKIILLAIVTLGLLIPLMMANSLVSERQSNSYEAIREVSNKWGGHQLVLAPMIEIPYLKFEEMKGKDSVFTEAQVYLLPHTLKIKGQVDVEIKKRSIYSIPVYNSDVAIEGAWSLSDLKEGAVPIEALHFDRAKVVMGLSELKGVRGQLALNVRGSVLPLRIEKKQLSSSADYADTEISEIYYESNAVSLLGASYALKVDSLQGEIPFSMQLPISGSEQLSFAPTGGTTQLRLTSNWADPSFTGSFLPDSSSISKKGFEAEWNVVDYNRGYEAVVTSDEESVVVSRVMATRFMELNDHYAQSDRSTKYGILIILLTFVSIFFIEMAMKSYGVAINVFHYLLVGLGLVLFYSLLISISEIVGFSWAYLISSLMTISLIGVYFRSLLPKGKHSWILVGIMSFLYLLVFLLIQMTTYALLAGSIGLFIILAIVMYVSSKLIK